MNHITFSNGVKTHLQSCKNQKINMCFMPAVLWIQWTDVRILRNSCYYNGASAIWNSLLVGLWVHVTFFHFLERRHKIGKLNWKQFLMNEWWKSCASLWLPGLSNVSEYVSSIAWWSFVWPATPSLSASTIWTWSLAQCWIHHFPFM